MDMKTVGAIALAGFIIVVMAFAVPPMLDDPGDAETNETNETDVGDEPDEPPEDEPNEDDFWNQDVEVTVGPIQEPDPPEDDPSEDDESNDGVNDGVSSGGGGGASDDPEADWAGNGTSVAG